MSKFVVRKMVRGEIPSIAGFPPPEWKFDAVSFFSAHFGKVYFLPVVAKIGGELAGIANALLFGRSAWLGNIVVAPEYRRRGLGMALTAHLVARCRELGSANQMLIATEMGRPVYEKLGFVQTGEYVFLKPSRPVEPPDMRHLRPAGPGDIGAIALLDRKATAEERRPMLGRFIDGGFVHRKGAGDDIDGFYLPGLGQGPVIAENDEAGLALLMLKHSRSGSAACLPSGSASGMRCLQSLGFTEDHRAPRMALGTDVAWNQSMVFARGAGYCG